MIVSMTGYGKAEKTFQSKTIVVEIRSLNSRTADIKLKLPNAYRDKELDIRNILVAELNRGKIDFTLNVTNQQATYGNAINKEKFKSFFNELTILANETQTTTTDLFALTLRLPDVIQTQEETLDEDEWEIAQNVIGQAIKNINNFRTDEGNKLLIDFEERLKNIETFLNQIKNLAPDRANLMKERLKQKIEELGASNAENMNRLEQEIIYYLEKFDINEEIVRLKTHCDYFLENLHLPGHHGKKLGFITQEIGREINTIGSKANHAPIQKLVVQMKDELEKMKEQSLNVL